MSTKAIAFGFLCGLSTILPARAEFGATAGLGTTGAALHFSAPLTNRVNARFGLNGLGYDGDGSTSNVDYRFKLKMANVDALLDYFPADGGFRATVGIVYNGNKVDANGRPLGNDTYLLNGHVYPTSTVGSLDGQIEFRKLAPYLGIGWGNAVSKRNGWGFSSDIGVLFQGSPGTSLTNKGCTASAAVCSIVTADVAVENRALQDKARDFKAFPVLRIGVSYTFR